MKGLADVLADYEAELARSRQQVREWTENSLRLEGAVAVLMVLIDMQRTDDADKSVGG